VKSRYLQVDVQQKVRAEFCQSLNQLLGAPSSKENPRQLLRFSFSTEKENPIYVIQFFRVSCKLVVSLLPSVAGKCMFL
jgi:hypothetical protein